MPALEEVDCEFIGPGGARVERALGDVVRCPVAVRGACATSDAHPRDASRQQSDSAKPSLARAVRDAALSNGALTEITRALSQSTRDGAAPKAALAWHPTKEILATTDDGGRCATRDAAMDDKGAVRARKRASDDESECEDEVTTLRHRAHGRCAAMAWRPRRGRALALAGASGVCVWTRERRATRASSAVASETGALSPVDAAKVRALAQRGTSGKTSGYRWRLTIYNERGAHEAGPTAPPGGICASECVAWSPDGLLLVACSRRCRVIHCWDVSAGTYTPLGGGGAGISRVAFSACGGYLLAAHVGEGFSVWQCDTMTCRKWSTNGREVTAMAWGNVQGKQGDAPVALIATRGSAKLSAVHLSPRDCVNEIAAHVLPLELPDIVGGDASRSGTSEHDVADMVWDASSSRLALALRGGDRDGVVALYATRTTNIVSSSLIGYFDTADDDTGARVPAQAVKISTPLAVAAGRLRATLAVAFANGDVALVPLTFADPSLASAAS